MLKPIVALLHNQKLNRWHPIFYREAPLPGPVDPAKPTRHKSTGHHTAGFATRDEALAEARLIGPRMAPGLKEAFSEDLPWDGEGIPADVAFFVPGSGDTMKRAL